MKTDTISVACACLVDVVGSLILEIYAGVGISAEVTRTARARLAEVDSLMRRFSRERAPSAEPVDPELRNVIASVIGRLTIALDENMGIDSVIVAECCESVASAHSMLKALQCTLVAATPSMAPLASARPRAPLGPILVLDDEPLVRRTIVKAFLKARKDLEIIEAASAEKAWKVLRSRSDWAGFLFDVTLEHGTSGLDVLAKAYELHPHVTAVVISGYESNMPDAIRLTAIYGATFMKKPCSKEDLHAFLRRCEIDSAAFGAVPARLAMVEVQASGRR